MTTATRNMSIMSSLRMMSRRRNSRISWLWLKVGSRLVEQSVVLESRVENKMEFGSMLRDRDKQYRVFIVGSQRANKLSIEFNMVHPRHHRKRPLHIDLLGCLFSPA